MKFRRLIDFLDATGEFRDEVLRLRNWYSFLKTMSEGEAHHILAGALRAIGWFAGEAKKALGTYTTSVATFLSKEHTKYRYREDGLLCGKSELEYHVNMVGSEIVNWGYTTKFLGTPKKVVLLPGCMRGERESTCKAQIDGLDITCTGCTPTCAINSIRQIGLTNAFVVYIVPHSSGFTRWLKRFENTTEYGVVAVACVLNIIVGGYEMRSLKIPSQCVLLDYCGCRKHWSSCGIATGLNCKRLLKVLEEGVRVL